MANGKNHVGGPRVKYDFMIPTDELSAEIGQNKDSEGPFEVAERVIVRQGETLVFVVLAIILVAW